MGLDNDIVKQNLHTEAFENEQKTFNKLMTTLSQVAIKLPII